MTRVLLVLGIIAVTLAALVFELVRRRQLKERFAAIWAGFAALVVLGVVFPYAIEEAAKFLGFELPVNLVVIGGVVTLAIVGIHLSVEVTRLNDRLERVVSRLALLEVDESEPLVPSAHNEPPTDVRFPTTPVERSGGADTSQPLVQRDGAPNGPLIAPNPDDDSRPTREGAGEQHTTTIWAFVVIGLLLATIGLNVALFPQMHENQGKFALQADRPYLIAERMAESGNPLIRGTWVLHHRIAELVGDGRLLVPEDHGLDTTLLEQVLGLDWSDTSDVIVPEYAIVDLMSDTPLIIEDHTGAVYYLIEPQRPSATYLVQELPPLVGTEGLEAPNQGWIVVSAVDAFAALVSAEGS